MTGQDNSYALSALTRRCSLDLYRDAVFFLMTPDFTERSMIEKVVGRRSAAALGSLAVIARRMARIW